MSYYLDPNKFTERLRTEWEQYNGLIIAVDFDSTLFPFWEYEQGHDYAQVHQLIRDCVSYGCTIIINTAASVVRHPAIKHYLEINRIPYHYFNESPSFINDIGRGSKVYANVYLDDRAGMYQVFQTLSLLLLERKNASLERWKLNS